YGFAPEDNLAYAHIVRLDMDAIAQLNKRYQGAPVLNAWPVSDQLARPELGYVKEPWDVCRIEDFTLQQIDIAAQEPQKYSVAVVFSTKYDPQGIFTLGSREEALNE